MNALTKVGLSATVLLALLAPTLAHAEGTDDEVTSSADRKAQAAKAEGLALTMAQ